LGNIFCLASVANAWGSPFRIKDSPVEEATKIATRHNECRAGVHSAVVVRRAAMDKLKQILKIDYFPTIIFASSCLIMA
jgi:hypothetical protein